MADPLYQFVIKPIVPFEVGGIDLSFTNSSLWMIIAAGTASIFLLMAARPKALVPGRMQATAELLYEFVANMIRVNTGSEGRQYFPYIFTLFVFILMGNVVGLIPGSFTFTSHIIVTFALAMSVFFAVTIFGFINHGLKFLQLFAPPGVPLPLQFLLVPIELISFMSRPVTLSVRLFMNMMVGHILLKLFAGIALMFGTAGLGGLAAAVFPVILNVGIYMLELFVACLQAYIFALLSCVYLKDTIDLHH